MISSIFYLLILCSLSTYVRSGLSSTYDIVSQVSNYGNTECNTYQGKPIDVCLPYPDNDIIYTCDGTTNILITTYTSGQCDMEGSIPLNVTSYPLSSETGQCGKEKNCGHFTQVCDNVIQHTRIVDACIGVNDGGNGGSTYTSQCTDGSKSRVIGFSNENCIPYPGGYDIDDWVNYKNQESENNLENCVYTCNNQSGSINLNPIFGLIGAFITTCFTFLVYVN